MVAWLKKQLRRVTSLFTGKSSAVVAQPVPQICPTCGQPLPVQQQPDTFDYENWTPDPAPPDVVEKADVPQDHVFDANTYYHVASKDVGAFDTHPDGEGNPDNFIILRGSRKLPPQFDEEGKRCRQLDIDTLMTKGIEDVTSVLPNVYDSDLLADNEFEGLWLQGNEGDLAFWSQKAQTLPSAPLRVSESEAEGSAEGEATSPRPSDLSPQPEKPGA